jgi:hypothetical protein
MKKRRAYNEQLLQAAASKRREAGIAPRGTADCTGGRKRNRELHFAEERQLSPAGKIAAIDRFCLRIVASDPYATRRKRKGGWACATRGYLRFKTYSSGARGGEQKRKAAEENKVAKGEQKRKAAEELDKKKLQITLSAHFKYPSPSCKKTVKTSSGASRCKGTGCPKPLFGKKAWQCGRPTSGSVDRRISSGPECQVGCSS